MKILQVHKYLYRKAGAESYVLDLTDILRAKGHQVKLWSAGEGIDFSKREGLWKDLKKFGHMLWSRDAARKFEQVLREFKPDIIHIHNIYHHISPSILPVAKKYKAPVVMTVHDYHLINPNYTLYDHSKICELSGWRAIAHRCIQNSYAATLAGVIENRIFKRYYQYVQKYIVPTGFVKGKLVEGGVDGEKIEIISLPQGQSFSKRTVLGDYILFAGRLVEEKGIYLLLEIAKQLPDIQFKIAGAGVKLEKLKNVELLGFVEKEKLQDLIDGARLVIVPSLWYDPSPYAVLEAMAMGKVVIASRIGGIQELIQHNKTGFLLEKNEWIDTIKKIYYNGALLERVGQAAKEYIERAHNPEKHYEKIMEIYSRVINH